MSQYNDRINIYLNFMKMVDSMKKVNFIPIKMLEVNEGVQDSNLNY